MGGYFAANNSVYLGFNATIPFQMASSSDDNAPINGTQNAPFGFNTALLSNISAVMLDVPEPDYLASIQQNISDSESWYISATVNGTVATMNMSTEYRTNDTLWEEAFKHTVDGPWSWSLYDGFDLSVLVGNNLADPGPYCFAGYYVGSSGSEADFGVNSMDVQKFRNSAFMINLNRQRCAGEWLVTPSRVSLISASCTGELTNQTVFATSVPFQLDAMPVMVHSLSTYFAESTSQSIRLAASLVHHQHCRHILESNDLDERIPDQRLCHQQRNPLPAEERDHHLPATNYEGTLVPIPASGVPTTVDGRGVYYFDRLLSYSHRHRL
jgi:hypothetical protein